MYKAQKFANHLHLGSIDFRSTGGKAVQSGIDDLVDIDANSEFVRIASDHLGLETNALAFAICNRTVQSAGRKSFVHVQLNRQKAMDTRDCLARAIYDRLFKYIISSINEHMKEESQEWEVFNNMVTIGLLDIFGFEILKENSFEQLCINYCNEILQQHFNYVIFTAENELYSQEAVVCDTIEFSDNANLICEIEGTLHIY
jgi:myosin heavy subunit